MRYILTAFLIIIGTSAAQAQVYPSSTNFANPGFEAPDMSGDPQGADMYGEWFNQWNGWISNTPAQLQALNAAPGVGWTFSGTAGMSTSIDIAGHGGANSGNQFARITDTTGSFSQTITLPYSSNYAVSFSAAQEEGGGNNINVLVDGNVIGSFSPWCGCYLSETTNTVFLSAGSHVFTFHGSGGRGLGYDTVHIDDIQLLAGLPGKIVTPYLNIPDFGANPTIYSVKNGNWSNSATWNTGKVPAAADIVNINNTVTYDVNDSADAIQLNTVEIKSGGTLTFSTSVNTQMFVTNLVVLEGGELDIGTKANPVPQGITAAVVWPNQPLNTAMDPEQYGNGLIALGTVKTYGAVKVPFVALATEPHAGDTTLTLAAPATGWQVGDKLELPDSRQLNTGNAGTKYVSEVESLKIASIPSPTTLTLSAPLAFDHLGAHDDKNVVRYYPHVLDMTRNVSIHSQTATGTRGYALFTDHANVDLEYTQFTGMGRVTAATFDALMYASTPQEFDNTTFDANGNVTHVGANEGNRNAINFLNLIGPSTPQSNGFVQANGNGYQFTFNGNVVTCPLTPMPFIWGLNVVNSFYGLIQNNNVVNWRGSGVYVDNYSSYNNFVGNFVMQVTPSGGGRGSGDIGFNGNGFWVGNSLNNFTNNVVSDFNSDAFGYGYAYEIYNNSGAAGFHGPGLGNLPLPAYQGADPSQPGGAQLVAVAATTMGLFVGNEAYGAGSIGMSYWQINYDPANTTNPPVQPNGGVIKNFVAWNLITGIYGYQSNNVGIDGFVCIGDPTLLPTGTSGVVCFQSQDYLVGEPAGNPLITNSTMVNASIGILAPDSTNAPVTIENSYIAAQTGILVSGLWSVSFGAPPRTTIINNVQFAPPYGQQSFTSIDMDWFNSSELAGGSCVLQPDQMFVYNYNGVQGDNFQIFYPQQAANFIVPQEMVDDGSLQPLSGAPVAGLTNQQLWNQYGMAIAGEVAP